jgi:AcrR family transcriptional regulator
MMSGSHELDALLKVKPKTERGKQTLARLCKGAEELFAEKNYYSAAVSEIAERAGISIGTFYIYFSDKLSLYKYMVKQYGYKLRKFIASRLGDMNLSSRYEKEREGIKLYLDFCAENPAAFFTIWQSLFIVPDIFIEYYDDFCKQYEKQLSDAVRTGDVHMMNLEVAGYVLMGACNFLAMKYIVFGPPSGLTDEQLYRIVDDLMFMLKNGMFAKKP